MTLRPYDSTTFINKFSKNIYKVLFYKKKSFNFAPVLYV